MQPIDLSIVIITYNQEKYIAQTLDSILNQKHKYNYEIVIGEDCSTDNTKKIIEEYVEKYPDIIKPLYNNPNKGLINNYFNVINHCQGKYIMECAGDDYWLQNKVKNQIQFMKTHPNVGMCYGKAIIFDDKNEKLTQKTIGSKLCKFENLMIENGIPALTVCIQNSLLKKYISEINPTEKKWLMEDFPLWLWISKESTIHYINQKFGVYRLQHSSLSHFDNSENAKRFNESCIEIREYFADKYNSHDEFIYYQNTICFHEAWNKKNPHEIIKYGKVLPRQKKTFDVKLKILLGYFPKLLKLLFN